MKDIATLEELIPNEESDLGQYEKILDETLRNDKLLNIALTGSYGAGKSSVIRAYNSKHKDKKFIYVTLTAFQKNTEAPKEENTSEGIAGKIINQLVHQMKTSDIPQTKFRVKELVRPEKIIKYTVAVLGLMISGLYCTKYWSIRNIAEKLNYRLLWILCGKVGIGVMGAVFLASLSVLTYSIIKRQLMHPFISALKIKGNEVPLKNPEEDENFDKYLDEIIYLFQKSDVNAIVFEDIDRFNDNSIYVKLREMNYLINERENVYWSEKRIQRNRKINERRREREGEKAVLKKETNKVCFIYLLRDDLFAAEDRTKFFDLIIPIVPITDSSNAYEQMSAVFEKHGKSLGSEQKQFLKRIMLYFNEQRLIKNIYNEFLIYKTQLKKEQPKLKINWERLFGYISYKNTYPEDFANLQLERGFAWTIISKKDMAIRLEKEKINNEIAELNKKIQEQEAMLQEEKCHNEEELLVDLFPLGEYELISDGKNHSHPQQSWKAFVGQILKAEKVNKVVWKPDNTSLNSEAYLKTYKLKNVADIIDEIKNQPEYRARMDKIQENIMRKEDYALRSRIWDLEEKRRHVSKWSLEQIYEKCSLDAYFTEGEKTEFEGYINNPKTRLVAFLIRNGYMDENYHDYMTYFYPTEYTLKDKNYMICLHCGEQTDFDYHLNKPELIMYDLLDTDYTRPGILNYDLLSQAMIVDPEKAKWIIEEAKEEKAYEFVCGYLQNEELEDTCAGFIELLSDKWFTFCKDLWYEKRLEELGEVIEIFLMYGNSSVIRFNYSNTINIFASDSVDYLGLRMQKYEKEVRERVIKGLECWKIEFSNFGPNVDPDTHQCILENGFFELNDTMIKEYLRRVRKCEVKEGKLITQAMEQDDILKPKIEKSPRTYFETILQTPEVLEEDEEIILKLFSEVESEKDPLWAVLDHWNGRIQNLKALNPKGWHWAAKYEKIENKVFNFLRYFSYCSEKLSPELIQWINDLTYIQEDDEKVNGIEKLIDKFVQEIISSEAIDPEKCFIILDALKIRLTEKSDLENVPEKMMEMLKERQIICATQ